ncbi:MAG TPA: glycine/sarcosine/betaine reductase selenoprotein B family protein [Acidimicrobiales bacterium]|nr:glycine/sarcosine/betaine reductase selenoprotein B family protein [Acidimicrobiales bacterium]
MMDQYEKLPMPDFGPSAFTVPPPLDRARVAIVTTAGLRIGDSTWDFEGPDFSVLEHGRRDVHLTHVSTNYDRLGFAQNVNVIYPVDRLDELVDRGQIGSIATHHLSFMGAQPTEALSTIRYDTAPAAAAMLREDGVDVVLMTPVCPVCTRTLLTIAHVLEQHGLATVAISNSRGLATRARAPRVLHCDFPRGRPLGDPDDVALQHAVLAAAFDLLLEPNGPVLREFPGRVETTTEPAACPLPPRHDPSMPVPIDEARGLRAAYERTLARLGRTNVGRVVDPSGVENVVAALIRVSAGTRWEDAGFPGQPFDAVADVRAYYEEASLSLAATSPAGASTSWFYRSTATGDLVRRVQVCLRDAGAPRSMWVRLVPDEHTRKEPS